MKKCWNCRRRRLKCDGSLPHCAKCQAMGTQCLGYGELVTWVGGIASRGHMKDNTFQVPPSPPLPPTLRRKSGTHRTLQFVSRVVGPDGSLQAVRRPLPTTAPITSSAQVMHMTSMPRALTDPILQDLDRDSRELVVYCESTVIYPSREMLTHSQFSGYTDHHTICSHIMMLDIQNPYRGLIPLVHGSKALENAILAVAACHISHRQTSDAALVQTVENRCSNHLAIQMMNRSMAYKQRTLRYLSGDLAQFRKERATSILATIVVLMLLELYLGVDGSWAIHLEGAKKVVDAQGTTSSTSTSSINQNLLRELAM